MEKKCSKCETSKPLDDFPNDPKCADGKRGACKECRKPRWKPKETETLVCNKCKEQKEYNLFAKRGHFKPRMCKSCLNAMDRALRASDPDSYNKKIRENYKRNKDKINETRRKNLQRRRDEDPKYRAMMALHCRLYMAVKEKTGKTMELTGCSKEDLVTHLESKFTEGMTWDNYGEWHIDHILPCASFNLEDPEEQKKCFHWTNLQPLWALDNIRKGAKIIEYTNINVKNTSVVN
jgi:hypothetical protein